jgi:hypothetical protein
MTLPTADLPIPYDTFVARLAKPGADILAALTPNDAQLMHAAIGLAGEASELLTPLRDYATGASKGVLDRANLLEELGDCEWYLEHLRASAGVKRYVPPEPLPWEESMPATATLLTRMLDAGCHLVVASGLVLDAVKRISIYRKTSGEYDDALESFAPLLTVGLTNVEAALRNIYDHSHITREEALFANEKKLLKRYESTVFSEEAAHARGDKADA